jgi:AcrR family transcriptional regulator
MSNVWLQPARTGRAGPPLTRERIVAEAVALLDEEGLDRLTMRRLAERLQTGSTTLYWHVTTKDDVIDLAVDAIFGEFPVPDRHSRRWRDDVTTLLSGWRQAILRHPWAAGLPARQRPLMGPAFLTWMEFLQAALVRSGLPGGSINAATWACYNHVMGSTASQSSLQLSPEEMRAGKEYLELHRDRFPTVVAHSYITEAHWDDSFDKGLKFLLDGIEAQAVKP